jgi:hypothetical protein
VGIWIEQPGLLTHNLTKKNYLIKIFHDLNYYCFVSNNRKDHVHVKLDHAYSRHGKVSLPFFFRLKEWLITF